MQQVQGSSSIVKLNVGAYYFKTSLETLTKDPNSKLAAMFSSESEMKPSDDGAFFIDRDGTHFRFILNYLRTGKLTLPEGATFTEELKEEAEFYEIQGLVEEFNKSVLTESLTTVKLNVGGHYFTTSLQTLTKDPNSMLAAMFSGKFYMKPADDGAFFIDRDGTHFRFILNYLRTGKLTLPEGATVFKEFQAEAEFYQIHGILADLKQISKSSTIVNLNVGGQRFTTSLQTLTKRRSKLAAMFSEERDPPGDPFSEESDPFSEESIKPSTDGSFFIDRDGKHFHLILNYLRDGKVILPEGVTLLKEVEAEAKFYKITEILEEFDRRREAARRAQIVRDLMMDSDE